MSFASITDALKILVSPAEPLGGSADPSNALSASLKTNLDRLNSQLKEDPRFHDVRRLEDRLKTEGSEAFRFSKHLFVAHECDDVTWRFATKCLHLLLGLKLTMEDIRTSWKQAPSLRRTPLAAPSLPPDVLSVGQQQTVRAALQFVSALGICPYLLSGVGVPLSSRSGFGPLLQKMTAANAAAWGTCDSSIFKSRLVVCCSGMLVISEDPSLGSLVLARHLGDLLAALTQLCYSPIKFIEVEERFGFEQSLHRLLDRAYQPMAVKDLLVLQGTSKQTPAWLRNACGHLLSKRLARSDGVQAVVLGVLEGTTGGGIEDDAVFDWQKCDGVARVISRCPRHCSADHYYQSICPQVLSLLHSSDGPAARCMHHVAVRVVVTLAREHPGLAKHLLLDPLVEPLVRCLENNGGLAMNDEENNIALAEEQEVSRCIEDMYKVFVIGNESMPALLQSLESVLLPLFGLYCFSRHGVSHLRSSCQELVCWYILKAEKSRVMVVLKQLCGLPGPLPVLRPRCLFLAGEEGGVRSVIQSTDEEEDEDEVLYCKLQEHQWKLDCLCNLLESLCDSALPGKFFLTCLKDLTDWVVAEVSEDDATSSEKKDSTTALGAVDDSREKQVLLLQLVSILCERLGHQALKDTAQIVEFVGLTLERGILSGEALNTESLKLAMGLLAALLAGEIELKSEDHATLKTLLPQLNELASMHSAPDIRELASDLCIALATHGVYTADSVTASAQCPLGRRAKVTPENRGSGHCTIQHNNKMENLTKSTEAAARNLRQRRGNVGKGSEQMSSGRGTSLQEVMEAAFDPGVPERAEALRTLTSLLKQRNLEALGLQEKILSIFLENVDHVDSFVYLSAIQGISILADICPERVLPQLLQEYGTCQPQHELKSQHPTISAPNILSFPIGKDTSEGVSSHAAYRAERTTESRMKLGEALMRATRALGSLVPHYKDPLMHAFLQGTRDPEAAVRASSLSNLGELCQLLGFSLSSCIQELTACLDAVIKMDPDPQVRRAGVHVITMLLRGLGADATQVLAEVLRQLYRLLKHAASHDNDQIAALHARIALDELDQIMRNFLFPSDNLQKRIVILP